METLLQIIEAHARATPGCPAVLDARGTVLDYGALGSRVRATALALAHLGVKREDRVAIVLPNGPDAAVSFLGVAACAAAAPLNPAYSRDEFEFYFRDLDTKLVVADVTTVPAAAEAARHLGLQVVSFPLASPPAAADRETADDLFARPEDVALVLHTSGTTSRPKIVPLSQRNLATSAHNIAQSLGLTARDRCLNVMPLFHVHGLIGAVLSTLAAGGSVVCTPGFSAEAFLAWLREFAPTWYTAVPTMHQAAVTRAQSAAIGTKTSLRFIRSCSSALPPTLMAELEQTFGVPVLEALGMTEASHQVCTNPLPPRARKPGSVGVPAGTEVAIMNANGELLAPDTVGEIVLRGAGITRGYARPLEANATAFTHGWFRTGDQGRIDADGYLFLTGRLKEIINRGGEKVSPREIDEALLEHPAVAQAVAFAVPHPTLGEDVAAAVVLRPGATATGAEIREAAFVRLAGFKVPSVVLVVDTIPKGPTGKLQRIGLVEKLRHRLAEDFVAPRDAVEWLLADAWQEVLGRERVGIRDNFFVIGGDSLRGSRVLARVNEIFDTTLPVSTAFRQPTVEQLANAVREATAPERLAAVVETLRDVLALSEEDAARTLRDTTSGTS